VRTTEPFHDLTSIHSFLGRNEDDSSLNPSGPFSSQTVEDNPLGEMLDVLRDVLSELEAESLLDEYRQMAPSFPFVHIPKNVSVQQLHAKRPMLLLAILTAATWKDRAKQTLLDERYRYELAQRAILQPRKSHSLIQSLLVYLAW
jgi:hypothetical protein